MKAFRLNLRCVLIAAFLFAPLVGTKSIQAKTVYTLNPSGVGALINDKLFGDYDLAYVVRGKPVHRSVNGNQVAPREGLLSSKMRSMAGRVHTGTEQVNYRNPSDLFARFNEYNMAIRMPEEGWTQLDPAEYGMRSNMLLSEANMGIMVSIGAEIVGLKARETNEKMLANSRKSIASLPEATLSSKYQKLAAPGILGYQYQAVAKIDGDSQTYFSIWVATRKGFNYSITVFGDATQQHAIDKTAKEFVGRLSQVQPDRFAWSAQNPEIQR